MDLVKRRAVLIQLESDESLIGWLIAFLLDLLFECTPLIYPHVVQIDASPSLLVSNYYIFLVQTLFQLVYDD